MNEDLIADLPPPLDDEPSSLRKDIADELGDHLACAFHRELVKSADEQTAKSRVLERFGDPRRIARQLWWQAMWSRIMLQKISIGLQSVLAVALLVLIGLQFDVQQHQALMSAEASRLSQQSAANQIMLSRLVEQLRDVDLPRRPTPQVDPSSSMAGMMFGAGDAGGAMGMSTMGGFGPAAGMPGMGYDSGGSAPPLPAGASSLSLVLTMEAESGPPVDGCLVGILDDADKPLPFWFGGPSSGSSASPMMSSSFGGGSPMGGGTLQTIANAHGYTLTPEAQGRIDAGRVDPGRYTAVIEFPNGWFTHHKLVVRPGEQRVEKIACPKPTEKAFVTITAPPVPEDLRKSGVRIVAEAQPVPLRRGKVAWQQLPLRWVSAMFNPATGQTEFVADCYLEPANSGFVVRDAASKMHDFRREDERFIVLPTGDYHVTLHAHAFKPNYPIHEQFRNISPLMGSGGWEEPIPTHGPDGQVIDDVGFQPSELAGIPQDESGDRLKFAVSAGQNTWTLDRAAELFESARKKLAELPKPTERPVDAGAPAATIP